MVRMDEVAVKQGFLHLQQQQTFGKVGTRLGQGRAEQLRSCWKFLGLRGSSVFPTLVTLPGQRELSPRRVPFSPDAYLPNQASNRSPNCALC